MRSDFINKRNIYKRRRVVEGTEEIYEMHFLPDFDTFIWWNATNGAGNSRWDEELGMGQQDNIRTVLPVAPLNPWNDANDNPESSGTGGPLGVASPVRTPTRSVLGFKLDGLSSEATIVGADLRLTVNSKKNWD